MSIVITNCLCCNAAYNGKTYECDCQQDKYSDCEVCWHCKRHCTCQAALIASVHPLERPTAQVWAGAVRDENSRH